MLYNGLTRSWRKWQGMPCPTAQIKLRCFYRNNLCNAIFRYGRCIGSGGHSLIFDFSKIPMMCSFVSHISCTNLICQQHLHFTAITIHSIYIWTHWSLLTRLHIKGLRSNNPLHHSESQGDRQDAGHVVSQTLQ